MKRMVCEMCNGIDLIKIDGLYVCQNCGTKYSVEDAKKMMIEGTVDVSGSTVKVDQSEEINNLYTLARRAKSDNNSKNAQKYYEQILVKDPSSWEANFYSVYYQSLNCVIAEIQGATIRLTNCEETVLRLIIDNIQEDENRFKAVDEMTARCIDISLLLFKSAKNHYFGIDPEIRLNYRQEYINNGVAARDIVYNCGDLIERLFGENYARALSIHCWRAGIDEHRTLMPLFAKKELNKNIILQFANKVKKYDPSYKIPQIKTSGCYIATAVYGSYDCPQVWTLRRYRDLYLAKTWYGREFIRIYYKVSPILVKYFGGNSLFINRSRKILDKKICKLITKGYSNSFYEDHS